MRFACWWLIVGASLLLACSSGGDDEDTGNDTYEEGLRALCEGYCAGASRCRLESAGCTSYCVEHYQPTGIRGEALAAVGACARDADCDTLASDQPTSACFAEVEAAEPLREQLISYCESAARSYFECDIWWSVDDCIRSMGAWEDDVLLRAQACHVGKCADLSGCEDGVFNPSQAAP